MYCFLFVISVGITINWNTVWPLLGFPILWLVLDRWVVRREERHLEATFGDQYRDYCRRVRRWM